MRSQIAVLGSTGSVGVSTLDVISRHPDRFEVFALTGATRVDLMLQQCRRFQPRFAVMADEAAGRELAGRLSGENIRTRALSGAKAIEEVASDDAVHSVMA